MLGLTASEQGMLIIVLCGVVQLVILVLWFRFVRREEQRRREVMGDEE